MLVYHRGIIGPEKDWVYIKTNYVRIEADNDERRN